MMKYVASLLVAFAVLGAAHAAPIKIKTNTIKGEEYVKALAQVCTDEEWEKVVPLIKVSKLAETDVPGAEFVIEGKTIKSGNVAIDFQGEKLKLTIGDSTYEGSICGALAQYATVPQKASAWSLAFPKARAQERFLPTTVTEALRDKFQREPAATMLALAQAGLVGLIDLNFRFCTTCLRIPSSLVDQGELERNFGQLVGIARSATMQSDFRVVSCDANTVTLRGGPARIVIDRRSHQVTVSNGRVTGHLPPDRPPVGIDFEARYRTCRSSDDVSRFNSQAQLQRQLDSRRLDTLFGPSPRAGGRGSSGRRSGGSN